MCRVNPPCGSRTNVQRSVLPPSLNSSIQGQLQGGASQTLYAVLFRLSQFFLAADQPCSSQSIHIYMAHFLYSSHTLSALVTLFPFSCICSPLHLLRLHTPNSWKKQTSRHTPPHPFFSPCLLWASWRSKAGASPSGSLSCVGSWHWHKRGTRNSSSNKELPLQGSYTIFGRCLEQMVVSYIGPSL